MSSSIVAFARDVLGFPLHPRQADILEAIYAEGIRTAVLRLGRRSGKGRIAAVVAALEATVNAERHLVAVPEGEQVAIVVVATSQRQARIVHRYIAGFLHVPVLRTLVVRETADEIELSNGIVVVTVPCSAASARGLAVAVVILDEAAWFTGVDGSPLDVGELWRALVPATAQFPDRRVLVLSSPRFASGWFADLCERARSGEDPCVREWHASTAEMNPVIPASFLEAEHLADPIAYRREYLAEFEAGISAALDASLVRAAVRHREPLPPEPGVHYFVAADPAFTGDRFAVIVGHAQDGRLVIDRIASWRGTKADPVRIDATLDAIADLARTYNGATVLIDQYAAQPIRQGLAGRSVAVEERPWSNESKVDALAALRRALYAGTVDLLEHRELVAELVSLEQRPTPSGRPRIAAPGGQHDDFATCLLALALRLGSGGPPASGATVPPEVYVPLSVRMGLRRGAGARRVPWRS